MQRTESRAAPVGDPLELADSFVWIRADTLTLLLRAVGVLVWLAIIPYSRHPEAFWPGWGTLTALGTLVIACYALRDQSYRLACGLFIAGLFLAATVFLLSSLQGGVVLFAYVPVVLIAGVLRASRASFLVAGAATLLIVGAAYAGATVIEPGSALGAMTLLWLAALTSWATTRSLFVALHWALTNSDRAEHNLMEARQYQGELAAANRQLEEANYRLERANHALSWARAEADQARQLKSQFAANISHELRTPINLVVGFAELMLGYPEKYGAASLPQEYQIDLTALHRNAQHLRQLIDDVLDLSQIDAGEMPLLMEQADPRQIVDEVVAIALPLFERKGLSLDAQVAPDVPALPMDRLRIRQVLLNLLNNAVRFTEQGGVCVRASRDDGCLRVEVADTGVGIAPDQIGALFQPFHQLEGSGTRGRGGTGLGLAISRHFVELHGGAIEATSDGIPGLGSTFAFTLPLEAMPGTPRGTPAGETVRRWDVSAVPPPTLVVLDDDPAVVGLFQRRLEGYHVVPAANRAEALTAWAEWQAHAILTDVPGSEGFPAWEREWSAIAADSGVRVVGCPMPSGRRVARTLGLVDYLVKPVTRDALVESVRAVAPEARTVLVADDEPQMVRLLCRMLRSASEEYRFVRAYDGEQALEQMRQNPPDLVLLDLLMPQVGGLAILERMRSDPSLAPIPVVVVSARGAFEAISPSAGRSLVLVADEPLPVSRLLKSVDALLSALPPAELAGRPTIKRLEEHRQR